MMYPDVLMTIWIFLFFIVCITIVQRLESFANSTIYDHPTKCFSCERDVINRLGPEWAWLGQNTKSFDAEKEMIRMTGKIGSAIDTHPIKYY